MPSSHICTSSARQFAWHHPAEYQAPAVLDDELKAFNVQVPCRPDGDMA